MPSGKRLDLNEALEDSPQTHAVLANMEASVGPLKDFVIQVKETCQTLHTQQLKVAETVSHFGRILSSADDKLFGDKDTFSLGALRQLGKHVSELFSWQEMLCIQIDQAIVQQLESFLTNDLSRVNCLKEAFHYSKTDHEQAITKYNRVSKKKETERSRFDANSDLFTARRRFHQSSLQYYAELNNLQFKKKFHILDPMLAFMHSQLAFFKMGHEILTDEVGKFLTVLNVDIQKVRSEYEQSVKQQKAIAANLEQQSGQLCIPDPDPSDPFVEYQPANLQLHSKSGYLLYRQQGSKWERAYFYTKDHLLYWQHFNRASEVLLDLTTEGVDASSTDIDDRRYVFQIITVQQQQQQQQQQQRKALYFQAESAKSRDEWIATFVNIVAAKRKEYEPLTGNLFEFETRERTDSDLIRMERERVRTFVQSHSTSKLTSAQPVLPQQPTHKEMYRPPLPPRRPPLPQQRQSRPPPPPPPFGGGEQNSVQKLLEMADNESFETGNGYMNSFIIRYLGSLEVDKNKGVRVVKETIRRIVAARALKNIMAVYHVRMVVTHKGISLIEPKSGGVTESFKMKDVSYCACHPDNIKLFGFIARLWENGKYKHVCYVFESEKSGKEVYQAVVDAIKAAVQIVTTRKSSSTSSSPTQTLFPPHPLPDTQDPFLQQQHEGWTVSSPPTTSLLQSDAPAEYKQRPMPKSLSTGSFRDQFESRMSLPDDDVVERDSGVMASKELLIDLVTESHQVHHEPPIPPDSLERLPPPPPPPDEPPVIEDTSSPIYATVMKQDIVMTTAPSSAMVDIPLYDTVTMEPPVAMTTSPYQYDTDSLLALQRATDVVTGAHSAAPSSQ